MIDRLIQQRQQQDADARLRDELYPDEADHCESSVVSFWQCRGCGKINAAVLGENVRALKCSCKVSVIINERENEWEESSVQWYRGPVI